MVAVNGGLEIGRLFRGHIAGNVAAVFVALVIIVGPARTLTKQTDSAAIQTLDLGDGVEKGLRSGLSIRGWKYMATGFLYLVAVMDWWSRYVLGWRLSNTMKAAF
jgi:hypothetical protein